MDTFWVIPLLIFGAIVSIGQKASKNTPSKQEEEDAIPTPEHEDIERRIREILEGKAEPAEGHKPRPRAIEPTSKLEQAPKPAMRHTFTTTQKSSAPTQLAKTAQNSSKKSFTKKADADPIKLGEIKRSEIGRIIDDFDIEKATIYAEIIKPKYEEY